MTDFESTAGTTETTQEGPSTVRRHTSMARRNFLAVGVFLVAVVLFTSTFRLAIVRGESMLPTYRDGQLLLVGKIRGSGSTLRQGDVVLVEHGTDVLIKRVAYLPGDIVPSREAWMFRRVAEFFDIAQPGPNDPPIQRLKVPTGYIVVLGDNRRVSEDSRAFGPVKESEVVGRVFNAPPRP